MSTEDLDKIKGEIEALKTELGKISHDVNNIRTALVCMSDELDTLTARAMKLATCTMEEEHT